ncbi:unnamed protein product [Pleuronectes platessa]|uniref:Uncharacterized protein n=1 Tax=Pleuronectes platessa TaxID=8262 RepID=A0A9N7TS88_PLEPL|nr:unnamed protein product [Pleuronectes platessa]
MAKALCAHNDSQNPNSNSFVLPSSSSFSLQAQSSRRTLLAVSINNHCSSSSGGSSSSSGGGSSRFRNNAHRKPGLCPSRRTGSSQNSLLRADGALFLLVPAKWPDNGATLPPPPPPPPLEAFFHRSLQMQ